MLVATAFLAGSAVDRPIRYLGRLRGHPGYILWDIFGRSSSGKSFRETSGPSLRVVEFIVAERGDETGE